MVKEIQVKIIKTASGKQTIKISKSEWLSIGNNAGWVKQASEKPTKCHKCGEEVACDEKECPECGATNQNYWRVR